MPQEYTLFSSRLVQLLFTILFREFEKKTIYDVVAMTGIIT